MWDLQGGMQPASWSKRTHWWPFTPSVRSSGHFLPKCLIATLPPSCLLHRPHWKYHLAIRMARHFKTLPTDPFSDYWRFIFSRLLWFVAETVSIISDPLVSHSSFNQLLCFDTTDKYPKTRCMYTSTIQTWRYLPLIASCGSPYLR